ncbi:hypothetical protein HPB47_005956 [Ixodes persulcatus]|uniref:Uncharacterized protein n=1 Tax=Ixodes persulcatus TaxID=34615 RepID=A0AC60PCF0_IXOPE|nr:hypothetical protein HPB47_005956 [Ixodes persulcatus]
MLHAIPGIRQALYASDITVWADRCWDVQDALQAAAETTRAYAKKVSLSYATEKSELLLVRVSTRNKIFQEITVEIEGRAVPKPDRLGMLWLYLEKDAKDTFTVHMIQKQSQQTAHLIRRVTNRSGGLKEGGSIRIVQALVVSRVTFHIPYHNFASGEDRFAERYTAHRGEDGNRPTSTHLDKISL